LTLDDAAYNLRDLHVLEFLKKICFKRVLIFPTDVILALQICQKVTVIEIEDSLAANFEDGIVSLYEMLNERATKVMPSRIFFKNNSAARFFKRTLLDNLPGCEVVAKYYENGRMVTDYKLNNFYISFS
jgi:hypothetical protein